VENRNYIGVAIDELYRMFDVQNKRWFGAGLPSPIITIQSAGRKAAYGWFTTHKVWEKVDGNEDDHKYEINICAEHLTRNMVDIAETLQHEMVHYYNKLSDIKDHSDNVHNKRFKFQAERAGLNVAHAPKYGWGYTSATDEFTKFIENEVKPDPKCFSYFRVPKSIANDKKETEKKTFKYTCSNCNQEIKGKKGVVAICGICNVPFDMEEE
jgi:predicted SprT family Zn-dependent metalloprotease